MCELKVVDLKMSQRAGGSKDSWNLWAANLGDNFTGFVREFDDRFDSSIECFNFIFLDGKVVASRYMRLPEDWVFYVPVWVPKFTDEVSFEEMFEKLSAEEKEIIVWNLDLFSRKIGCDDV